MLIQLDSQCWFNLALNVDSTWLSMLIQLDSQCWFNLTLNVDSTWLSMLIQLDSQRWANYTLNVESIRLLMLSQFDSNILQLPTLPGRILIPKVTQLFMWKWLNFQFIFYGWVAAFQTWLIEVWYHQHTWHPLTYRQHTSTHHQGNEAPSLQIRGRR